MSSRLIALLVSPLFSFLVSPVSAANLSVGVQPMLVDGCSGARFEELSAYLGEQMGAPVELAPVADNRAFRNAIDEGAYDIVVATRNFFEATNPNESVSVVATSTTPRSYRLVTRADNEVDVEKHLVSLTVAGESSPSTTAQAFVTLFPNPVRQPGYRPTRSIDEAWQLLANRSVDAALVPMLGDGCGHSVKVLKEVEVDLEVSIGVARHVGPEDRTRIVQALIGVAHHASGLKALDNGILTGFKPVPVRLTLANDPL